LEDTLGERTYEQAYERYHAAKRQEMLYAQARSAGDVIEQANQLDLLSQLVLSGCYQARIDFRNRLALLEHPETVYVSTVAAHATLGGLFVIVHAHDGKHSIPLRTFFKPADRVTSQVQKHIVYDEQHYRGEAFEFVGAMPLNDVFMAFPHKCKEVQLGQYMDHHGQLCVVFGSVCNLRTNEKFALRKTPRDTVQPRFELHPLDGEYAFHGMLQSSEVRDKRQSTQRFMLHAGMHMAEACEAAQQLH
jgi:hypothetical protein